MPSLIARRLAQALLALVAVLFVVFACLLATGDPRMKDQIEAGRRGGGS